MNNPWWKQAVIYEIYSRSFQDSNGDGIGDIRGIISRLGYLEKLGVDAVWLTPMYASPQADNGYDISDYRSIDPVFGSMEDMDQLIREAGRRGIRVIMDLVLNHTSDEHRWFQEARKSRDNPYHDYYVWRDGTKESPPNEMQGVFGGSCWTWVESCRQYYFHQFAGKQPDLNWENGKVRQEIYDVMNWWKGKGVGGFRFDVIDQIDKEPDRGITANGPKLLSYLTNMRDNTYGGTELVTVGETWGADWERAVRYSNEENGVFSMVFQFEHMSLDQRPGKGKWEVCKLDFIRLKQVLSRWQERLYQKGWNSLFWNNHDLPRIVSRWGDDGEYSEKAAKMLAILLFGMQGTPYIYQGEELGMTNVRYSIEEYRDIETLNFYSEEKAKGRAKKEIISAIHARSRDNARTPMQWSEQEHAGFTTGVPWMKVNPDYVKRNAKAEMADTDSVWACYRRLIALRKEHMVLIEGQYQLLLEEDPRLFVYKRTWRQEEILVVCNFFRHAASFVLPTPWLEAGELLISNYEELENGRLKSFEARMYLKKEVDSLC